MKTIKLRCKCNLSDMIEISQQLYAWMRKHNFLKNANQAYVDKDHYAFVTSGEETEEYE